jgi:hypothetical protein
MPFAEQADLCRRDRPAGIDRRRRQYRRTGHGCLAGTPRDLQQKFQAQFASGVVGLLVWQYATEARTDNYEVQPGDPTEAVMAQVARTLAGQLG